MVLSTERLQLWRRKVVVRVSLMLDQHHATGLEFGQEIRDRCDVVGDVVQYRVHRYQVEGAIWKVIQPSVAQLDRVHAEPIADDVKKRRRHVRRDDFEAGLL